MREYNICYSLDSQYTEQLCVSLVSILKNSDENDNHNFYILDGGLTDKDKYDIELLKNIKNFNIRYIQMDNKLFSDCPLLRGTDEKYKDYHVTIPTYYRFELPEVLPNIGKVLYLDCDIIVRGSLKELFEIDLADKSAGMILDSDSSKEAGRLHLKQYRNAGVMLINLDYWRKNKVKEKLYKYAKQNKAEILWQDQDIINCVLEDTILTLDRKWNYQYFGYEEIDNKEAAGCEILHLSGRFKPWLIPFEHPVYDCYYYYLTFTPRRKKVLEYKLEGSGKHLKNNIGGCETNLEINATDSDLEENYNAISKCYDNIANVNNNLHRIEKMFARIYDGINKAIEEKSQNIFPKVYEYINENVKKQEKEINKVYEEIKKIYDSIYDCDKEVKANVEIDINAQTDEKLQKIYDEIKKIYKSIYECDKEVRANVEIDINAQTDDKLQKIYDEITKIYKSIYKCNNDLKINIDMETNDKIHGVYEEISKNYKYTEELTEKIKQEIEQKYEKT